MPCSFKFKAGDLPSLESLEIAIRHSVSGQHLARSPSYITSPFFQHISQFPLLFDHYLKSTCSILIPCDDQHNPFRIFLPQMALHPSGEQLLAVVIALSAAHHAAVTSNMAPRNLISTLLSMAMLRLSTSLHNPTEVSMSDIALATSLSMASYHMISSDVKNWHSYLEQSRQIIHHRRRYQGGRSAIESTSIRTFLFKWFAYLEVVAGVRDIALNKPNYESAVSFVADVTGCPKSLRTEFWQPSRFDTLDSFASALLPLLLRIGKLAHQKRAATHMCIDIHQNKEFLTAVEELERDLLSLEVEHLILPIEQCDAELRACNAAFTSAARLHIQRRLRDMVSEQVSGTVQEIFNAIEQIPVGSHPGNLLLYPLFSAGIEARGKLRDYAHFRMTELEKTGFENITRARKVMLETWNFNGFVRWEDLMAGTGWDLNLD
jgi:hypothetical protein